MKITDILQEGDVVEFPSPESKQKLDALLGVAVTADFRNNRKHFFKFWSDLENYILDDKNLMSYRIKALKKLDHLTGDVQSSYDAKDVHKFVKETRQEARRMFETKEDGLSDAGRDRVERAIAIFKNILRETPAVSMKNAKAAAIKLAGLDFFVAEVNVAEKAFDEIFEEMKKKEKK